MLLFGILTVLAAGLWLWPLTRRVLRGAPHAESAAFFCGLGLSLGVLSLIMLWLGLLPGAWLRAWVVLPIPWIGLLVSAWAERDQIAARVRSWPGRLSFNPRWWLSGESVPLWLGLLCASALFAITVNLISYPFYTYDVLSRYAPNARQLYTMGAVPSSLVGYPLGVQMLYAFGFMAAGSVNDHLAGSFSAALVIGMVGAVWVVARLMFSGRAAWAATVLAVSAPVFVSWSTSAYIDIPDGFYHGLTFAMAYLWLARGEMRYALLTGVFGGLALWIKQSSLVLIPAIAVIPLLRLWPLTISTIRRETGIGASALGALGLIAGPWYLRSYLIAGPSAVVPTPSTYDALFVDHSLEALFAFWYRRGEWGAPFALMVLAGILLWTSIFVWPHLAGLAAPDNRIRRTVALWAAFVIPYHLIWWWSFTYQARYLFTSLPMYAPAAGLAVDWLLTRIPAASRIPRLAAPAVAAVLIGFAIYPRMGAIYHLVTDPLQTDDVKLTRLAKDQWLVSKYIRDHLPPGSQLYVMDGALAYWLYDYDLQVGYPTQLDQLREYDYYVVAPWGASVLAALGQSADGLNQALSDPALFTQRYSSGENGQTIYEIHLR